MEQNTIIFLAVLALLYFLSFLFSRKTILHEIVALWIWTIGFPLMILYDYFQYTMQRHLDFQTDFITSVILISIIVIIASFFEMRVILKRNPPHAKIFAWQPIVVTSLYFLSLIGGLIRIRIGYLLLVLSFIGSLLIYRLISSGSKGEV